MTRPRALHRLTRHVSPNALRAYFGVGGQVFGIGRRDAARLERLKSAGLTLGQNVFIGRGFTIDPDFPFLVEVGDDTTVSFDVVLLAHDASSRRAVGYSRVAPVSIGARVFVGARAVVL